MDLSFETHRIHMAITLIPLFFLWSVDRVELTDNASCEQVVGQSKNDIREFERFLKLPVWRTKKLFFSNGFVAVDTSHDISGYRACGVAVSVMVYSGYDGLLCAVNMP